MSLEEIYLKIQKEENDRSIKRYNKLLQERNEIEERDKIRQSNLVKMNSYRRIINSNNSYANNYVNDYWV